MKRLLFALVAFSFSCWATLPQTVRWNVEKTTGASDTNGGGFDTTKAGTDYSQSVNNSGSCAAKLYIDGSTVTAAANASTVTFTASTHTVATAEAGNLVYLATGNGLTVGWYEITAVSAGLNGTWTLERTTGMTGGPITGYMGGCLASPQQAMTNMGNAATSPSAADQIAYVKVGTSAYASSAVLAQTTMASTYYATRFVGYATSQTDRSLLTVSAASNAAAAVLTVTGHLLGTSGTITLCDVKGGTGNWAAVNGVRTITLLNANTFSVPVDSTSFGAMTGTITVSVRPLITAAASANGMNVSTGVGWHFENLIFDGLSAGVIGIHVTGAFSNYINVWVRNFTSECIKHDSGSYAVYYGIELSGCGGTTAQFDNSIGYMILAYSYIHNSPTKGGANFTGAANSIVGNVFANNAGASSDGLTTTGLVNAVLGNLFYGNGRDGFRMGDLRNLLMLGNRAENNGAYGSNFANSTVFPTVPYMDYNSYWGNVTAVRAPITQGPHDVNASVDPSVAATATPPNFGLNSTATGGKLLQGVGLVAPGLGSTGYVVDIGPLRHADPASSSGGSGSYAWVK